MSKRMNSTGSISRERISDPVDSCVGSIEAIGAKGSAAALISPLVWHFSQTGRRGEGGGSRSPHPRPRVSRRRRRRQSRGDARVAPRTSNRPLPAPSAPSANRIAAGIEPAALRPQPPPPATPDAGRRPRPPPAPRCAALCFGLGDPKYARRRGPPPSPPRCCPDLQSTEGRIEIRHVRLVRVKRDLDALAVRLLQAGRGRPCAPPPDTTRRTSVPQSSTYMLHRAALSSTYLEPHSGRA